MSLFLWTDRQQLPGFDRRQCVVGTSYGSAAGNIQSLSVGVGHNSAGSAARC